MISDGLDRETTKAICSTVIDGAKRFGLKIWKLLLLDPRDAEGSVVGAVFATVIVVKEFDRLRGGG